MRKFALRAENGPGKIHILLPEIANQGSAAEVVKCLRRIGLTPREILKNFAPALEGTGKLTTLQLETVVLEALLGLVEAPTEDGGFDD
jgi:hypothetical protein